VTSDKKIEANRNNSKESTGPTSPQGKDRTRLNASKWGLFSKELVVPAAGEKQEDFNALISGIRDQFRPQDFLTVVLAELLATTIWRLRRPLRCETAEIRKQYATAGSRRSLEKISEAASLKGRFIRDFNALCATPLRSPDRSSLSLSLEETRKQLEQTSLGLEFLLEQVEPIKNAVDQDGYLSADAQWLLMSACGVGAILIIECITVSQIAEAQMEKLEKNNEEADRIAFEQWKKRLSALLKVRIQMMRAMKTEIEKLESREEEAYIASLAMLPAEVSEKIYRAETGHRRDLFKTLDALKDVLYGSDR